MKSHPNGTHHGGVQKVKQAVTAVLNWLNSGNTKDVSDRGSNVGIVVQS